MKVVIIYIIIVGHLFFVQLITLSGEHLIYDNKKDYLGKKINNIELIIFCNSNL